MDEDGGGFERRESRNTTLNSTTTRKVVSGRPFDKSAVKNLLTNPIYIGKVCSRDRPRSRWGKPRWWQGELFPDSRQYQIQEDEAWERVRSWGLG